MHVPIKKIQYLVLSTPENRRQQFVTKIQMLFHKAGFRPKYSTTNSDFCFSAFYSDNHNQQKKQREKKIWSLTWCRRVIYIKVEINVCISTYILKEEEANCWNQENK